MLRSTFIHAPGVGAATERMLWKNGVRSWDDYTLRCGKLRLSRARQAALARTVEESLEALRNGEVDYFARALPTRHHWRAASDFPKLGFLDIETDVGYEPESVTIIGLYDGFDTNI